MSHHHLRTDKTCQNCGHEVPERFCTSCGQENIDSRMSFGHLASHFFEDLTHYEGRFWKTMLYLIGRPAYLTKAYLAGKRNSFVPPVRLYFFISFVTFLLPHFLPEGHDEAKKTKAAQHSDTAQLAGKERERLSIETGQPMYHSLHDMDSVERTLPAEKRLSFGEHFMEKARINAEGLTNKERKEKFINALYVNFPKSLFIYLPLFALVLWIFHGKRRWMYFDHAIFTIHYFCFMMLVVSLMNLLAVPFDLWGSAAVRKVFSLFIRTTLPVWFIYYFFRAHRKMYQESWFISAFKGSIVFILNFILLMIVGLGLLFFAITSIH